MNIDYNKLVQLLLPTFLRKTFLIELFRPLVVQLQTLQSQFNLWLNDARYKANSNASVISLTELIQRELDVLANIEELDGLPTDFKVTVSGTVDEVRLRSLINQYKIAGRSFTFRVGNVIYSSEFINHVQEDLIELYSCEFIGHVTEEGRDVTLTYTLEATQISFTASRPVMSELSIQGVIRGRTAAGLNYTVTSFEVVILVGEITGVDDSIVINIIPGETYTFTHNSSSITPSSDSYFNYKF